MDRKRRVLLLLAVGLLAAACSSVPSGLATTTTRAAATHHQTTTTVGIVASSTTTTNAVAPSSSTSTTVPFIPINGPVGEFYSPSHNISCEIDYVSSGPDSSSNGTFCLTVNPPQAVTLNQSGDLRTCTGPDCLANAGVNTAVLEYGTTTGAGPFVCLSRLTGMTCTVNGAAGFTIAMSGITPQGGATIVAHGTNGSVLQP